MFEEKGCERRVVKAVATLSPFYSNTKKKIMKLLQNIQKQPLLQLNDGQVINLNTLENTCNENVFPVKAGNMISVSKHKNQGFIEKAAKLFSVSKIKKAYGKSMYLLESNFYIICIVQGETIMLLGNYPVYYLKLLYRYINNSL